MVCARRQEGVVSRTQCSTNAAELYSIRKTLHHVLCRMSLVRTILSLRRYALSGLVMKLDERFIRIKEWIDILYSIVIINYPEVFNDGTQWSYTQS